MRRCGAVFSAGSALALLAGCTFQSTLDNMVSRDRQAELVSLGKRFCTDRKAIIKQLHPELAASVMKAEAGFAAECPVGGADWRLASYRWDTNINSVKQQKEEAVVVGVGKGKWTTVSLRLYGENDAPKQIVQWHVVGSSQRPRRFTYIEEYDAGIRTARIVAAVVAPLIAGLVYWLIRRRRAKRAA